MPKELPIQWDQVEKAALTGVSMHEIAKGLMEHTPALQEMGYTVERLYAAIRKRASRERWAVPDMIMRRARVQAKVVAGVASDPKEASKWAKGEVVQDQLQQSRDAAGMGVPRSIVDGISGESSRFEKQGDDEAGLGQIGGVAGGLIGGRGALQSAPVTATELVTRSLAERGQSGLSLALDAALASLASLDPTQPVPIRSMTDLLTAVKATKEAAGLDKPAVAVAVSLNSAGNATIETWQSLDSA
jgi:hypothetical protein